MNWDITVGLAFFVAGVVASAILVFREERRRARDKDRML